MISLPYLFLKRLLECLPSRLTVAPLTSCKFHWTSVIEDSSVLCRQPPKSFEDVSAPLAFNLCR